MPPQATIIPSAPMPKIGKWSASMTIVRESWGALMKDREILWLPVFSFIATMIAVIVIGGIYFAVFMGGSVAGIFTTTSTGQASSSLSAAAFIAGFIFYIVTYFIQHFFQVSLYTIAYGRFNGQDLTLKDGLRGATSNFGGIMTWSVVMATVGVILDSMKSKGKLGAIVSALMGATWNILTYFSLISLTIGKTNLKGSFTESVSIIRKTWGEALIVNFGAGFVFGVISFIVTVAAVVMSMLLPFTSIWIAVGALWLFVMVMISIISTTLGAIFKLALYEYGKTGKVPEGFSPEIVQNAFRK
jgi:hypothetical protein